VRATIVFHIRRNGTVEDASVETSSGVPLFDQVALRAVLAASPLPPLPADFKMDRVRLLFDFEKVPN
jgi:TonB family protein